MPPPNEIRKSDHKDAFFLWDYMAIFYSLSLLKSLASPRHMAFNLPNTYNLLSVVS